jgi:hypothetical protein
MLLHKGLSQMLPAAVLLVLGLCAAANGQAQWAMGTEHEYTYVACLLRRICSPNLEFSGFWFCFFFVCVQVRVRSKLASGDAHAEKHPWLSHDHLRQGEFSPSVLRQPHRALFYFFIGDISLCIDGREREESGFWVSAGGFIVTLAMWWSPLTITFVSHAS